MSDIDLDALSACEAARAIADGRMTSEELVSACLDRIARREPELKAWAFLQPELALAQARAADQDRRQGRPLGPLHGVPVGIKDIIDTFDMPTEDGTPLHAGRRPRDDATVVALLRRAGAVILGKTVTTELAVFHPGPTRNPHDPMRTPGGSSSGSAAAVAAGMVPLAVGSQTNGSMIRPASFCGVVGYKPTHGMISRKGALMQSRKLDHLGLYARRLEDVALAGEVVIAHDPGDPDTRPAWPPGLRAACDRGPALPPRLAFLRTPKWEFAEEDTRQGFAELVEVLGDRVREVELPAVFAEAWDCHKTIMEADIAFSYAEEYDRGRDQLSAVLRGIIERGREVRAVDYQRAVARVRVFEAILDDLFADYDAVITPAAPGEAPQSLESTGNPVFCTPWTLTGVPALSLPLLEGRSGMPIGVQVVAAKGDDARLFGVARWLLDLTG